MIHFHTGGKEVNKKKELFLKYFWRRFLPRRSGSALLLGPVAQDVGGDAGPVESAGIFFADQFVEDLLRQGRLEAVGPEARSSRFDRGSRCGLMLFRHAFKL
jgi:hypothetical protein